MPLIAYQNAHGQNDLPLHFAFFECLERRGLLDRFDFCLDPVNDSDYCDLLVARFPQLSLTTDHSLISRIVGKLQRGNIRGSRILSKVSSRVDAVCEAPGGRIHPAYLGNRDIFWRYPNATKRAILFHSFESAVLELPVSRSSVATADLFIARSAGAGALATQAGVRNVVISSDIVFSASGMPTTFVPGIAAALRVPSRHYDQETRDNVIDIMDYLETRREPIDYIRLPFPLGEVQDKLVKGDQANRYRVFDPSDMYDPFRARRDAVISCGLHVTILALQAGTRNLVQFQVEHGTRKLHEIFDDIGLHSLVINPPESFCVATIRDALDAGYQLPEREVTAALHLARSRVEHGLDAFEDWLQSL